MSALRSVSAALLLAGLVTAGAVLATEPPPGTPPGVVPPPSIHQAEWEEHALRPAPEPDYPLLYGVVRDGTEAIRAPEAPTKTIYGFMPYWVASDISHVQWDLLTHVAYFSVDLNPDGSVTNLTGSYAWPSGSYAAAVRNAAHANGVKVTLAATNFSSTEIATLLSSSTNRQNAINDLKAMVQGYGDGVNIDLEGVPVAQKANLVTFMTDLKAAFHTAIPGSHVTLDTPAVDWSGAFDYDQLALASDGMFIMGYDYYWSGSSTAGPCAPLTSGSTWGTRNVTWTVNDYITYGGAENRGKFILGLPYYGRDWPTTSTSVPSSTTAAGTSKVYDAARSAAATYGRLWNDASQTPYYTYTSSGTPHQGWYDDAQSLGLKWDLVNSEDLGGTGMWALNYDKSDDQLWDKLRELFTAPSESLAGVRIGIDPGHGGTDSGAVGPTGLTEKAVNLATSLFLRDALLAEGASVYMTRSTDATLSLTARTDYLNSIPVDRAESCHYNASGTASANYTGVHIYDNGTNTCPASASSKDMATKTAARLDAALGIGVVSCNCTTFMRGVHGDNFHMVRETTMPSMLTEASFISNPTEEGLLKTDARRCAIAGAIAKGIEDHYGAPATEPPCAGPVTGTCANPIVISSFPFTDSNTTVGKPSNLNWYSPCSPGTDEGGPEVIYQLTVQTPGNLTVTVQDLDGADIDIHLLSECSSPACLIRNNLTFTYAVQPGTYFIVCDTYVNSGVPKPGAYPLTVSFAPTPGDTTAPAVPQNLKWSRANARWEWSPVTTDRLGAGEVMGYYQMWRSTSPGDTYTLFADNIPSTFLADATTPTAGSCHYYQLHAVDAAGNRDNPHLDWIVDNPQATFAGSWSTGSTTPGHWGDDYRFVSTGGTGANKATWSFGVDETGLYDISIYYPSGTNRSDASRFTATYAGGTKLYTVNQQVNGGKWVLLGSHWMTARQTYTVVLDYAEPSGFVVLADAVRWAKAP